MAIQISVFIENKEGRIKKAIGVFEKSNAKILSEEDLEKI